MSDHDCVRCIQCDSCPVCAADALYREVDENERLRERLDQFDAHGFPNVAAALDRVNAAESRAARYEEALREANRFLRQFHGSVNLASVMQLTEKIDAALAGGEK